MQAVTELGPRLGFAAACSAVGLPKATYYRRLKPKPPPTKKIIHRALGATERRAVLDVLHEARFAELAPAEVYATLLDEGQYLCSERTMYRVLAENAEVRERRNQLRHPKYKAPELLATAPNQLWSWDITKLLGHLAMLLRMLGLWRELGFASFAHYCAERLGMAARTVEQRAGLERRLHALPALRRAMRERRLSYEKARLVAGCADDASVNGWIERAERSTCIALRREIEAGEQEQTR